MSFQSTLADFSQNQCQDKRKRIILFSASHAKTQSVCPDTGQRAQRSDASAQFHRTHTLPARCKFTYCPRKRQSHPHAQVFHTLCEMQQRFLVTKFASTNFLPEYHSIGRPRWQTRRINPPPVQNPQPSSRTIAPTSSSK
jgi:hypothetical protein